MANQEILIPNVILVIAYLKWFMRWKCTWEVMWFGLVVSSRDRYLTGLSLV